MQAEEAKKRILEGKTSQAVRRKLIARTPQSAQAKARSKSLSQEIVRTVALPHAIYIDAADGCRMTDVDGNAYIDMTMGFGPCVLGHRPPAVAAAVQEQLAKGWHFGIPNALQAELAMLVENAAPCGERVVFFNTGAEATLSAMRAAAPSRARPESPPSTAATTALTTTRSSMRIRRANVRAPRAWRSAQEYPRSSATRPC